MSDIFGIESLMLAKYFHDKYEELAPSYGYSTRNDTKKFDELSSNGKLMTAVCDEVIEMLSKLNTKNEIELIQRTEVSMSDDAPCYHYNMINFEHDRKLEWLARQYDDLCVCPDCKKNMRELYLIRWPIMC